MSMQTNHENIYVRIEEGGQQPIAEVDFADKEVVLKLYILKKHKSTTNYIFSERVPVCEQMKYPGYTKRLALPYYLELESINDRIITEKEDMNGTQKLEKITSTLLNAEVLKKNNVNSSDIQWMLDEMKKVVDEADGRRTKLSDALSENPYKPPRTLFQIVNGESAKRDLPSDDKKKKEFCLEIKDGENPIISFVKFVIIMVIGCFVLPFMLISLLLAFIYDTCIGLVYGHHKVTFQEQNWFEEMHRKNKDCDTESIDDYIKLEIQKIVTQLSKKYPSLSLQFLITSNTDSDSDEFSISFMGKKKTDAEFQKEMKSRQEYGGEFVAGFVASLIV